MSDRFYVTRGQLGFELMDTKNSRSEAIAIFFDLLVAEKAARLFNAEPALQAFDEALTHILFG